MKNLNFTITDQFDSLTKRASFLLDRQGHLDNAPESDFAVVLWNGQEKVRKFPVSSPQDVVDSYEALEKNASTIPDELLKMARANIDTAHREFFGDGIYSEDLGDIRSNSIFVEEIDMDKFEEKKAGFSKIAHVDPSVYLIEENFPLNNEGHIKTADDSIRNGVIPLEGRDLYFASKKLIKRANDLGVTGLSAEILRFSRDEVDPSLYDQVQSRKEMAKEAQIKNLYSGFLEKVGSASLLDAAEALEAIDKLAGFVAFLPGESIKSTPIGTLIPNAFDTIFPKIATEKRETYDLEKVAHYFGERFAENISYIDQDNMSQVDKRILETCEK